MLENIIVCSARIYNCFCSARIYYHNFVIDVLFMYYIMKQILSIARGQRQILHQLENLTNNLHNLGEVFHQTKSVRKSLFVDYERVSGSVILTLAIGGVGIFLFRGYISRI